MANPKKKVLQNSTGEFFVDTTCIDCDACRQLAPATFADAGEYSYVYRQPDSPETERRALQALLACPTGSIGTMHTNRASQIKTDFPLHIEEEVYYCGFNSPESYGGNSYFIKHSNGNWLVDSPKFLPHLVRRFEEEGGLRYLFLTHKDDVADAARFAAHFGCQRIIHRLELPAQPEAEIVLDGLEALEFAPDFRIIPTPGHTAGHCVLLMRDQYLFTGDHLSWSRPMERLSSSRDYCWYSWTEQTASMARLLAYRFTWVLPGHGQRVKLLPERMHDELQALVQRMRSTS